MKKRNKSMKLIMAMSLLFVFSITESLAQEIPLQPNQTENTYKTWNVNGIVDIQIRDARDRGKALEGSHKIKYRCRKDSEFQFTDVVFEGGLSKRLKKICALIEIKIKEKEGREIKLRADAEKDGFTVSKKEGLYYLNVNNVIDPVTKKPLEGKQGVEVAFYPDYEPSLLFRAFRAGTADPLRRKILSLLDPNPRIDIRIVTGIEEFGSKANSSGKQGKKPPKRTGSNQKNDQTKKKSATGAKVVARDKSSSSSAVRDDARVGGAKTKTVKKKETVLNKNGKGDNSYRVRTVIGNDDEKEYDVTLERVKDPDTGEVVTGVSYFVYRCADEGTIKRAVKVNFNSSGNAVAKAVCDFVGRPSITFGQLLALAANANVNGYSLNGSTVNIRGVENPEDGKKIEGAADLVFSCYGYEGLYVLNVILQNGTAELKAACLNDPKALFSAISIMHSYYGF